MSELDGRTIMHFKDGTTLTERDLYPHQLSEEQFQNLTSVERVVKGWHLSILKSDLIKNFFILTEAHQALKLGRAGRHTLPPQISFRALGCYLKDSDPPVKLILAMDPLNNVFLESTWTKDFRPDGFSARLHKPQKGVVKRALTKSMGKKTELVWSIVNEPPVRRVYGTPNGLGCLISVNENLRVKAELRILEKSCHLIISPE